MRILRWLTVVVLMIWIGAVLMRLTDLALSVPRLFLALMLVAL